MIWRIVLIVLAGYLLGNLNGSILISNSVFHDDVRTHGSGNAGMTNFLRTYGKAKLAGVVLIDMGKAVLACVIGWLLLHEQGYADEGKIIGGVACMVGHAAPVFFGLRGGKSVLAACAVALCMHWWTMLIALAVFIVVFLTTHYVSAASMTGVTLWSVMAQFVFCGQWCVMLCAALMAAMVIFLHRANIVRLWNGTENKMYLHLK